MRDDFERFTAYDAKILAVAPDDVAGTRKFSAANPVPFPLLADESHEVFDRYDVASKMLSLGQRPALFVVDADGVVRYNQVGVQQWEIPPNEEILRVLAGLSAPT